MHAPVVSACQMGSWLALQRSRCMMVWQAGTAALFTATSWSPSLPLQDAEPQCLGEESRQAEQARRTV